MDNNNNNNTEPLTPTAPATQTADQLLLGLAVRLPDICSCGHDVATIGARSGPHAARLLCARCGKFRGWLPHTERRLLVEAIKRTGVPAEPIAIRRGRSDEAGAGR
jgi:hypothetical protein